MCANVLLFLYRTIHSHFPIYQSCICDFRPYLYFPLQRFSPCVSLYKPTCSFLNPYIHCFFRSHHHHFSCHKIPPWSSSSVFPSSSLLSFSPFAFGPCEISIPFIPHIPCPFISYSYSLSDLSNHRNCICTFRSSEQNSASETRL